MFVFIDRVETLYIVGGAQPARRDLLHEEGLDRLERRVERQDLRVHRQFAQSARNQLGELRTEIQDNNSLMIHGETKRDGNGSADRMTLL